MFQKIPKSVKIAILIVILAKLLIFSVGYIITYMDNPGFINNTPQGSVPATPFNILMYQFAKPLAAQDTYHYFYIAQHGYDSNPTDDQYNFIVFLPLYPLLIRLFTIDFNYINFSALAITNICSIIAFIYLHKLTRLDFDSGVAQKAVLFLSIFPTAYFLSVPYTEGLFFALIIASLYYARLTKWPLAGLLGFLATLTRLGGLLMLPVLLVEYLHQKGWKPRKIDLNVLWVLLVSGGFLIYLNINNQVTGNPFAFMEIERIHWFNTLDPVSGLSQAWSWATHAAYPLNLTNGIAPIVFAVFGLAMLGMGVFRRLRPSYLAYMLLAWLLAISTSFWISVPRYVMAMFPMFILLGTLTHRKTVNFAITTVFTIALIYFTAMFAVGSWAF